MGELLKNKAFKLGVLSGVLFFLIANIYSVLPPTRADQVCFDCYESFGFPFVFYESGTISHLSQFIWAGVVANISIALFAGFILGLIFKFVWSKIAQRRFR
jgi:hypothetical protein